MADFKYWNNKRNVIDRITVDGPEVIELNREENDGTAWTLRIDGMVFMEFHHIGSFATFSPAPDSGHTFELIGGHDG